MNIQKPTITLAIVIIIRGLAVGVVSIYLTQNTYAIKTGNCPYMDFLWEHTYGAGQSHWSPAQTHSRLKELSPACVVFTGNVTGPPEDTEHDGDLHFNVTPDNTKDIWIF